MKYFFILSIFIAMTVLVFTVVGQVKLSKPSSIGNQSHLKLIAGSTSLETNKIIDTSKSNIEGNVNNIKKQEGIDTSPQIKTRIKALTSLFENDTIDPQYSYIENLHDGRGYTAGIAGFVSADSDMYDVVKTYCYKEPGNRLSKYLNVLKTLSDDGSDSTSKLGGFSDAWIKSASDPLFKLSQDEIVDKIYYQPAMKYATQEGLESSLGKAIMYDSIIQHGDGDDADSLGTLISNTNHKIGGNPKSGVDEKAWLLTFLKIRKDDLSNAHDESTREVWAESTGRCDVYLNLVNSGNLDLQGPIKISTSEYNAIIP